MLQVPVFPESAPFLLVHPTLFKTLRRLWINGGMSNYHLIAQSVSVKKLIVHLLISSKTQTEIILFTVFQKKYYNTYLRYDVTKLIS